MFGPRVEAQRMTNTSRPGSTLGPRGSGTRPPILLLSLILLMLPGTSLGSSAVAASPPNPQFAPWGPHSLRSADEGPGDEAFTAADSLTLDQALRRALEVAPRIRRRASGREAAEVAAGLLTSPILPTAMAGASATRFRHPTIVTPIREPGAFPPLSDEVGEAWASLSWTVFDFGRGRESRGAARALADAAGSREEQARMETLETVADHFLQLAVLDELGRARRSRLEGLQESEGQVRALVAEGRLPAVDQLLMTELLMEAETEVRSTDEEIRRVVASLGTELALDDPLDRTGVRPPALPAALPSPLAPAAELRGPGIEAAEAGLATAHREAREASRALLPQVQLVARQSWRTAPDIASERDWALGLQVQIPLFRGDALASLQIRDARVRERSAELEDARASLERALRDLAAMERDARDRIRVLDARIGHLEEAHRIETASYTEGRTTLGDVLSTEGRLAAARAERITLVGGVLVAHLRTAALTGELSIAEAHRLLGEEP